MTTNREIFNDSFFDRMTAHLESRGIDLARLTTPQVEEAPVEEIFNDDFFLKMAAHLESRSVDLDRVTMPQTEEAR